MQVLSGRVANKMRTLGASLQTDAMEETERFIRQANRIFDCNICPTMYVCMYASMLQA